MFFGKVPVQEPSEKIISDFVFLEAPLRPVSRTRARALKKDRIPVRTQHALNALYVHDAHVCTYDMYDMIPNARHVHSSMVTVSYVPVLRRAPPTTSIYPTTAVLYPATYGVYLVRTYICTYTFASHPSSNLEKLPPVFWSFRLRIEHTYHT